MVNEKCKHGLTELTCWLCKGGRQDQPISGGDSPSWFVNSIQMAVRSQWSSRQRRSSFSDADTEELLPKGTCDFKAATSLPYRRRSKDGKTTHQYLRSIRKEMK